MKIQDKKLHINILANCNNDMNNEMSKVYCCMKHISEKKTAFQVIYVLYI